MEVINERGEINFNRWMEKMKDFSGLIGWAYRCV
jgi:hypothetical protein